MPPDPTPNRNPPLKIRPGHPRPPQFATGCVLTIGVFDGLHRGHQAMLAHLIKQGRAHNLPAAAMTFHPDPATRFTRTPPAMLMSWRERMLALAKTGLDATLCLPFTPRLARLSAHDFVADLLVRQLGIRHLTIGDDFRFGAGQKGDHALLTRLSQKLGFSLHRMPTLSQDGKRISSTRIRHCLAQGDLTQAKRLLGTPYQISGRIIRGQQLGQQLGFPTANIALRRPTPPMTGVYVVHARLKSGQQLPAVANLGPRPTLEKTSRPLLEVHLLDYAADLYGQHLTVQFLKHLRPQKTFANLTDLRHAIAADIAQARAHFKANPLPKSA